MTEHLYELTRKREEIYALLEETGGEITPEIQKLLDECDEKIESKVENTCKFIRNMEASEAALKAEAKRLNDRAKVISNQIAGMKNYLLHEFVKLDTKKITAGLFTVTRQKNGQAPMVIEEDLVPESYKIGTLAMPWKSIPPDLTKCAAVSLDKTLIKEDLKSGKEIPGCHIGEAGEHIRIK